MCSLYWGRFLVWVFGLCLLCHGSRYFGVLLHTFHCNFGKAEGYHSLYGGLQGSLNQGLLHQGPTVLQKGPPYLGIGGYVKDHQSFVVNLMAKF